jgi:hypothetical protein
VRDGVFVALAQPHGGILVLVRPGQVHGPRVARQRDETLLGRHVAQLPGRPHRGGRLWTPEQGFDVALVLEGLRLHGEGAGPGRQLRGECRVLVRDHELLSHEEERRGQALRRLRAHTVACAFFGERAAQDLGGLRLVPLVSVQPTEQDQSFGEIIASGH